MASVNKFVRFWQLVWEFFEVIGDPGDVVLEDGEVMPGHVTAIGGDTVTIDLNHPLAGETLNFAVEIVEVRDASAEELEHGHPHGPGGHQH